MRTIDKIRFILNILFMAGAVVTIITYFAADDRTIFFYAGVSALSIKMIEFILRFIR